MQKTGAYLRLMRLHQPVGIWLVFWPCAWATMLANTHDFRLDLLLIFMIGSILTRSAGCIVNDMADRDFDAHVTRTKNRPLASGELHMKQAAGLLVLLTVLSASLLLFLPPIAFYLALPAVGLILAYPFMKRITWWPQAFLGVTFNWGVLIAWGTVAGEVTDATLALYTACICWTLGYDTIYGHQDKQDDARIGVKSTALRLGSHTRLWVAGFYAATVLLMGYAMTQSVDPFQSEFYAWGLFLFAAHCLWQVLKMDVDSPANCLRIFKSNAWAGALPILPLALHALLVFAVILLDGVH